MERTQELIIAKVGTRFLAMIIDALILLVPAIFIGLVIPLAGGIVLTFLYKAIFEASVLQATPGKRVMNLIVTDIDGKRISVSASFIRCAVSIVSGIMLCIGHIIAFFTQKNQTVHDLIANTMVLKGKIDGDLFEAWSNQIKTLFAGGQSLSQVSTVKTPDISKLETIEKLKKLLDGGAITQEEFNEQKKKALAVL